MAKKFFTWLLLFIGISLVLQSFRPAEQEQQTNQDDFVLTMTEETYSPGETVAVQVSNNLEESFQIASNCPGYPLLVQRYDNGVWHDVEAADGQYIDCGDGEASEKVFFTQPEYIELTAKETTDIAYDPWKQDLFSEFGRYRIVLQLDIDEKEKSFSTEFSVEERGFFSSVGYNLFFRPIFNFLLFLTSVMPGHNFGLAVILLTIAIRLALLVPSQKALKSQRAMMKIQPEIEAIKKKYKGDQQKISQETMALWKRHRVNPAGGCLPLLIQLPVLIALFYVVKAGFSPYQSHMVYDFLNGVELARVSSNFFGILDLQKINATWLPLLVGLLQFGQMKLSFARSSKKEPGVEVEGEIIDVDTDGTVSKADKKKSKAATPQDPMKAMSKTMIYFMPVMIALMTASLPSGVGLYLAVSTLFGAGQQFFVNKST